MSRMSEAVCAFANFPAVENTCEYRCVEAKDRWTLDKRVVVLLNIQQLYSIVLGRGWGSEK